MKHYSNFHFTHTHTITHTRSRTHDHAHTITYTHDRTHTITHTRSRTHDHAHTITHTRSRTHDHAHTITHTITHTRTHPHNHTHTITPTQSHPPTYIYTHELIDNVSCHVLCTYLCTKYVHTNHENKERKVSHLSALLLSISTGCIIVSYRKFKLPVSTMPPDQGVAHHHCPHCPQGPATRKELRSSLHMCKHVGQINCLGIYVVP